MEVLAATETQADLYTTGTLFTQAGMTFAAWGIPAVLVAVSPALQRGAKFFSLVIALVLTFVAAFLVTDKTTNAIQFVFVADPLKIIVAIINGFVVAAAALGINQVGSKTGTVSASSSFWTKVWSTDWL